MSDLTPTATFNYLAPLNELKPPGTPYRLNDIRDKESNIGLDVSGWDALNEVPTVFQNWEDDGAIRDEYYADIIRLLKDRLGATRVTIFDHTVRRRVKETEHIPDQPGNRQPVYRVHVDQTPTSGRDRIYRHDPADADRLLGTRTQIINVWRPLRGPVLDAPLGLCHRQSMADSDFVESELRYPDRLGSTYLIHHNPEHQWYYLTKMQPDEALLIKCYDNKLPKMIAAHTGFSLEVPRDVQYEPRQSIEVRCIVYYEDQPLI
ncbi:uncharacterized protein MKK02DRAFT_44860 [Dioszegia hungarica]|uniref:Methyltransferase n=1 Tax=Dioszegia hungarica TaxID=4972 RepID=A0AA38H9S1_9TREE|nr:uncharacterized protein MKK02DRAFT_44860 [Dioszegia hungarica]KAI9636156.1 hypothetical protein MKK02DRAFT_44860 [Dioszegia hungarica]